jgi:hypothetical protein
MERGWLCVEKALILNEIRLLRRNVDLVRYNVEGTKVRTNPLA